MLLIGGKIFLRIHQRVWNYLHRHRTTGILKKGGGAAILGLLLAGATVGIGLQEVQAQTNCANDDQTARVVADNTWGGRVVDDETHHASLASNLHSCISRWRLESKNRQSRFSASRNKRRRGNIFPYGQCTWWANQRYFQLHGVFVPWRTRANAWQWKFRAYQFHWHVSNRPSYGAIIDLQPWTEGAYGAGHVAVVERVLRNGRVIASTMNWGAFPRRVVYVEFAPGPGVSFISQY